MEEEFQKCEECNGKKYLEKDIVLKFNCKYKNIVFPKMSNEMDKHIAGNIYLNIIPKDMRDYRILDNQDLLYIKYINKKEIDNGSYIFTLKHFDNETYEIKIDNPILGKEYIIENMGLYNYNDSKRNNLIVLLLEHSVDNSLKIKDTNISLNKI